jgi:hypothetical protein
MEQEKKKDFPERKKFTDLQKMAFIANLLACGFTFGGRVNDSSIKGPCDFNLIYLDEEKDGYEIKGRTNDLCLYEYKKGKSQKGIWYNYDRIVFEDDFFFVSEE